LSILVAFQNFKYNFVQNDVLYAVVCFKTCKTCITSLNTAKNSIFALHRFVFAKKCTQIAPIDAKFYAEQLAFLYFNFSTKICREMIKKPKNAKVDAPTRDRTSGIRLHQILNQSPSFNPRVGASIFAFSSFLIIS
jgi:hypothetical protein